MVRVSKEQSGYRRPYLTPSWLRRCLVSDIKQNNQPDLAFPPPGLPPGPPSVPLLSQASKELVASLGLFPMARLHCGIFYLPHPCSGAPSYLVTVVTLLLLLRCSGIFRSVWGGMACECRWPSRTTDPPELEVQVVVSCLTWVLGTYLELATRVICEHND